MSNCEPGKSSEFMLEKQLWIGISQPGQAIIKKLRIMLQFI